jgi:predicted lysophospholipase L1 biosynthesis ABC-type transport system permease subunit
VGLVIYTASVEREREYGVLKAIGAHNRMLYGVVAFQALIAAGAGAVVGIGLALGAAQLIMTLRPEILISLEPSSVVSTLATGLVMALLAAFFRAMVARAPAASSGGNSLLQLLQESLSKSCAVHHFSRWLHCFIKLTLNAIWRVRGQIRLH